MTNAGSFLGGDLRQADPIDGSAQKRREGTLVEDSPEVQLPVLEPAIFQRV